MTHPLDLDELERVAKAFGPQRGDDFEESQCAKCFQTVLIRDESEWVNGNDLCDPCAQEYLSEMGPLTAIELIRLARLGQWAEQTAIPALNTRGLTCDCCGSDESVQDHFDRALAALPKERE